VATTENARKNDVQDRVRCGPPEQLGTFEADILLANILANPLIELAPDLARRVRIGGQLVLSGVLADQADDVSDAYRTWFEVLNRTDMDGWVRLDGTRLR
nr:50S ribosomal protein L11 methyltransferase [Methylotetracoccus sp.]